MTQNSCDSPSTLTRELDVRIVDVSASGCLIETRQRLGVGTVGKLTLKTAGAEYEGDIEVVRCQPIDSASSVYHIGVRFLQRTGREIH